MTGELTSWGLARGLALVKGGNVIPGPYPAPLGYRWNYLSENGVVFTENGSALVELVRAA